MLMMQNIEEYSRVWSVNFEKMGINIDKSCIDECRLRFYSYDENPYINRNAENYTYDVYSSNTLENKHKQKKSYKTKPPKPQTLLIPNVIETFLRPNNLDFWKVALL